MRFFKKIFIVLIILSIPSTALGWRMSRPLTLTYPLDERQVRKLNGTIEDIWNLGNGRLNLNSVTAVPTNADNGDIWFIITGSTTRIQYKNNDHIYTITPDGF